MKIVELLSIAVGLAMDAMAISACIGLGLSGKTNDKNNTVKSQSIINFKNAAVVGLYFGLFQAIMPLIGYFAGVWFADKVSVFGHWITFFVLLIIGVKMIKDSLNKCEKSDDKIDAENPLKIKKMLPLAIATSIDALAVGVSFAFIKVNIFPAVFFIGAVTFILSVAGVKIGGIFGTKFKSKAELAGGIVLVIIGAKILIEHLFINQA